MNNILNIAGEAFTGAAMLVLLSGLIAGWYVKVSRKAHRKTVRNGQSRRMTRLRISGYLAGVAAAYWGAGVTAHMASAYIAS